MKNYTKIILTLTCALQAWIITHPRKATEIQEPIMIIERFGTIDYHDEPIGKDDTIYFRDNRKGEFIYSESIEIINPKWETPYSTAIK